MKKLQNLRPLILRRQMSMKTVLKLAELSLIGRFLQTAAVFVIVCRNRRRMIQLDCGFVACSMIKLLVAFDSERRMVEGEEQHPATELLYLYKLADFDVVSGGRENVFSLIALVTVLHSTTCRNYSMRSTTNIWTDCC